MVIQTRRQARIAQADAAEESPNASPAPDPDVDQITDLVQNASIDNTRHRPTPSEIEELEVAETQLLGQMKDTYTKAGAEDLDVFDVVKELLQEASQAVKSVEDYKSKPDRVGWTVTAVSLSRLTSAHMDRLGIVFQQPIICDKFKEITSALLSSPECTWVREQFLTWNSAEFSEKLELWSSHLGAQNEASNRILLHQYIYAALLLCRKNNTLLVIIPEPVLARKGAYEIIENFASKSSMLLTGLADYCLISLEGQDKKSSKKFPRAVEDMQREKMLDKKLEAISGLADEVNFMLIELKDNTKDLRAHLPQAVGEAVIAAHKKKKGQMMAFCLTNVVEWIFGVLKLTDSGYKCWTTETLTASTRFGREDQVKALVLWATASNLAMRDAMRGLD